MVIIQVVAAFLGTLLFGIVFNVAKKELLLCGLTGAVGWFVYLIIHMLSGDIVLSSFVATVMISILSELLARIRRNPVTIFQIGGIFPIVPGAGMYQTIYYIVNGKHDQAGQYLFETLEIAGSIAVGMVLISSLNRLILQRGKNESTT